MKSSATLAKLSTAALALAVAGCASLGSEKKDDPLTLSETSAVDFKPVAFDEVMGLADYSFGGVPQKASWVNCKAKTTRFAIFVVHSDRTGYEEKEFCGGWIAQTFLSQGFDVVTVNRPGYGASTGKADFAGEQSMAAMAAGLKDAVAKGKNKKPVDGIWGYSSGAAAAATFAKKNPTFRYLIVGGGIYDYETTLKQTTDSYIKADIEQVQKTGGDKAMEDRSIGYDVSGLPKRVAVYHGKQDTAAPLSQAKAFNDALESNGSYKVTYQVIEGVAHDLPWTHHRKILEILSYSIASAN